MSRDLTAVSDSSRSPAGTARSGLARWRRLGGLAWRESRTARRRLLLYMSSISLGVAALVAIDSFAEDITRSIEEQSRALVGGDLSLSSNRKWPARVDSLLDSLARTGTAVARVTTFPSMGLVQRTAGTRFVQVRAVTDAYPLYGEITTSPAGAWSSLGRGAHAIVDTSLLVALDAKIGDTLSLGMGRFAILGTLINVPGDPGLSAALGPRVYIPDRYVAETNLLVFGSRAEYDGMMKLKPGVNPDRFLAALRPLLERDQVRARSVTSSETIMTESVDQLGKFLGIVGLMALLLGGVGVASGVHAFVARKIDTVAVLRCLGATSGQVVLVYVVQAAAMGLLGAAAGALLGIAVQFGLPHAIDDFLPVDVKVAVVPSAIGAGLLIGLWVAMVFALRPLIALRSVSPLQAIRRDTDDAALGIHWRDLPRMLVTLALIGSVVLLSIDRVGEVEAGLGIAAALAAVLLVLFLSATALSTVAKKTLRSGWPYVVRQGVANLYRPANQTRAVVISLGFGAFLVTTLYQVRTSLLAQFSVRAEAARGNLLFFDVQEDQVPGMQEVIRAQGAEVVQSVPIVTMRVSSVNGVETSELLKDTTSRRPPWPLRREYRSTYRGELTPTESLTAGKWHGPARIAGDTGEVSLEAGIAEDLRVKLGDVVTWNVQGVMVPTRVTSLRRVNWSRFETNFFAVFSPGSLDAAPKMFVMLGKTPNASRIPYIQRAAIDRFPNVSGIDLSTIQKALNDIVGRASTAVQFLAIFSFAMGIPVLFSAVAATRRERMREGVLLKTLGATRAQIGRIMFAEYALLGVLGSLTGMLLAIGGGWALTTYYFKLDFTPAVVPALGIALTMLLITVGIGLLTGRDVFRETPMAALREA